MAEIGSEQGQNVRVGLQWDPGISSLDTALTDAKNKIDSVKFEIVPKISTRASNDLKDQLGKITEFVQTAMDSISKGQDFKWMPQMGKNLSAMMRELASASKDATSLAQSMDTVNKTLKQVQSVGDTLKTAFPENKNGIISIKVDAQDLQTVGDSITTTIDKITERVQQLVTELRSSKDILEGAAKTQKSTGTAAKSSTVDETKALKEQAAKTAAAQTQLKQSLGALSTPTGMDAEIQRITKALGDLTHQAAAFGNVDLSRRVSGLGDALEAVQDRRSALDFSDVDNVRETASLLTMLRGEINNVQVAMDEAVGAEERAAEAAANARHELREQLGNLGTSSGMDKEIKQLNDDLASMAKQAGALGDSGLLDNIHGYQEALDAFRTTRATLDFTDADAVQQAAQAFTNLRAEVDRTRLALSEEIGRVQLDNLRSTVQDIALEFQNVWSNLASNSGDNAVLQQRLAEIQQRYSELAGSADNFANASKEDLQAAKREVQGLAKEVTALQSALGRGMTLIPPGSSFTGSFEQVIQSYGTLIAGTEHLNAAGTQYSAVVQQQNGDLVKLTGNLNSAAQAFSVSSTSINQTASAGQRLSGVFKEMVQSVAGQITVYRAISMVMSQMRKGWDQIQELDAAYTELRKVSDDTTDSLMRFREESFAIADTIATTGQDIQESAADFARLGYAIDDAAQLARNTSLFANVGDMDIDTATSHMISAVKAFGQDFRSEVEASVAVGDVFNELDRELSKGAVMRT